MAYGQEENQADDNYDGDNRAANHAHRIGAAETVLAQDAAGLKPAAARVVEEARAAAMAGTVELPALGARGCRRLRAFVAFRPSIDCWRHFWPAVLRQEYVDLRLATRGRRFLQRLVADDAGDVTVLLSIKLAALLALPDCLLFAHVADHGNLQVRGSWRVVPVDP
jgi:hypothetical protein